MPEILIADDDRAAARALQMRLEHAGYSAVAVTCGKDAIDQFDLHQPSIVFLDASMPDVSGFDVSQHIRDHDPDNRVTVVFVSGACVPSLEYTRRCAGMTGANAFISKPYDIQRILEMVEETLGAPMEIAS